MASLTACKYMFLGANFSEERKPFDPCKLTLKLNSGKITLENHPTLNKLKTGHKVALTKGKFSVEETSDDVKNTYAVTIMLTPSKGAEVSFEGEYGFSYMNLAEPEEA